MKREILHGVWYTLTINCTVTISATVVAWLNAFANALISVNEVDLHWDRLVLRWVDAMCICRKM